MKSLRLIFLPIILLYISSYPQTTKITIHGINDCKAYLYSLEGEKTFLLDSISISLNSTFEYSFSPVKKHPGFYRFSLIDNKSINFIYDKEEIEIVTDAKNILDSIKIIKSKSNNIYYEFLKKNKEYKTKSELLQLILERYPEEDDYYQLTKEKLKRIQEKYLYFVNVTSQAHPNSLIARYVRSAQLFVVEDEVPFEQQLINLKTHSLDKVDFHDEELIYSDVFTNKTIEYLTYYRNPQLQLELLEKEFYTAIDTILSKAKVNEIVYTHIVEYLLDGFKEYGFDSVINYIVENYVIKDDLCLNQELSSTLERRIQQAKNFKRGIVVPDIILSDTSGSLIDLNKINSNYTLIIFYSSWCPHCQKILPQIYDLYKNQKEKKFEVLAVSIDTSRIDWLNFVRKNSLNWTNVSDLKGWNGKASEDYFIYATPTMILVDKNKKLINLPKNLEEIKIIEK